MKQESQTTFKTILLLALPASGKSEVRKYLASLPPTKCQEDFNLGPTVQLDDFPYVHLMRRIDDELELLQKNRAFFTSPEKPFKTGKDWGTLIELINEDYSDLLNHRVTKSKSPARHLLERIENAALRVGASRRLSTLDDNSLEAVAKGLEKEAVELFEDKNQLVQTDLTDKTIVIEFARGGAQGSSFPLKPPYGYQYSLGLLSDEILNEARILYIWVTPEESRRKNQERTNPSDPGSILHHGVPLEVMLQEYGCDDMDWLESQSKRKSSIAVQTKSQTFYLPISRFDNRIDKTSFIRKDPKAWQKTEVQALHESLKRAFQALR